MPGCPWGADQFLQFLNHVVCMEDGKIHLRTDEERNEQQSLSLNMVKSLVFTQEIDAVIIGFCSWDEDETHLEWLRVVLDGMKPQNILMFARCCGSYTEEFQETIRNRFPERTWLFPEMVDLYDNFGSDPRTMAAAECLLKADIIGAD